MHVDHFDALVLMLIHLHTLKLLSQELVATRSHGFDTGSTPCSKVNYITFCFVTFN